MDTRIHYKKVLLVHPLGYKMEAAGHDVSRIANIMPPLGLASIAAYLGKKNICMLILLIVMPNLFQTVLSKSI